MKWLFGYNLFTDNFLLGFKKNPDLIDSSLLASNKTQTTDK
ncbi:MAG: hypothetical protein CM15mP129_00400 [Chloroflexota bacterium]|nr:MAG: hypothetical protein CM15mP129_00400 [Chloroflexota bacterium]